MPLPSLLTRSPSPRSLPPAPPGTRRDIATMLLVTLLSWTGQRLTAIALPLVALDQTGSMWTTGLVGGMAGLPMITAPWWGARLRQKLVSGRALACVLMLEVVGLCIVPLAATLGEVEVWHLALAGLVTGLALALAGPGARALLSDVADQISPDTTVRALSAQDFMHRLPMVYAPPLAAWAIAQGWAIQLLWAEAIGVAIAVLLVMTVRGAHERASELEGTGPEGTGLTGTAAVSAEPERPVSIRSLLPKLPDVTRSLAMSAAGGFLWVGLTLGMTLLGAEMGREGALIGAAMAGYGATSITMSFFAPFIVPRLPALPTHAAAWVMFGLSLLALPMAHGNTLAIAIIAGAGGLIMPLGIGAHDGLISRSSTGHDRRALFTADSAMHSSAYAFGMLTGGGIIGAIGAENALYAAGALQVAIPVLLMASRGRR